MSSEEKYVILSRLEALREAFHSIPDIGPAALTALNRVFFRDRLEDDPSAQAFDRLFLGTEDAKIREALVALRKGG